LVFFSKYMFPSASENTSRDILDILGIFMVLLGYLLRIIARGEKAQRNPDGKTLVTEGLYQLTRNPMYLGTLFIGLGVSLVLFRWWVCFIFLAVYLAIYIPQINREEEKLVKIFGDKFRNYCKTTPKYFPRVSGLLRIQPKKYLKLKLSWVKKELNSLIWMFISIIVIQGWRDLRLFGHVKYGKEIFEAVLFLTILFTIFILNYGKNNHPRKS